MRGEDKLSWAYADDAANDHQERDRVVDRAVARIFAARARQEAVGRNRHGDFDGARHAVEATARRIRGYAGRDAELRAILAELEGAVQELAVPMREMERKLNVRPELVPDALAHGGRAGPEGDRTSTAAERRSGCPCQTSCHRHPVS